jgi:hypothetical protein
LEGSRTEVGASLLVAPWAPALVHGAVTGDGCQASASHVDRTVEAEGSARALRVGYDLVLVTMNRAKMLVKKAPSRTGSSDVIVSAVVTNLPLLANSAGSWDVNNERTGATMAVDGRDCYRVCNKDDDGDGGGDDGVVRYYWADARPHAQPGRQHSLTGSCLGGCGWLQSDFLRRCAHRVPK